jgi:hypothetical protein
MSSIARFSRRLPDFKVMQLPYAESAVVPIEKITSYLLNDAHPEGGGKAAFFRHFGFRVEQPSVLQEELLRLSREVDVQESVFAYGLKYVGVGTINCPNGRRARITTVWVLRQGQPPPYFVTAYPALMEIR